MLNKIVCYMLVAAASLFTMFMHANEITPPSAVACKYNLSLCTIFKNEEKFLKEWIDYHRDFGVDHFYLYSIGSSDSSKTILKPYIEEDIVTLINWPEAIRYQECDAERWALSTQIPAYENAVNFIARGDTKWLAFVDVNEFFVCSDENIKDLLKKYDDYAGIHLSSDYFDAAITDQPQEKLLLQALAATTPPKQVIEKTVAKMVFKPDLCLGFTWPPYQCRFSALQASTEVGRQELRINRYLNRGGNNSMPGKKGRKKQAFDHHNLFDAQGVTLRREANINEDLEPPNARQIKNILKKMGHEIHGL